MSVDTIAIPVSDLDPMAAALLPAGTTHLAVEFEYEPAENGGTIAPSYEENWGILHVEARPSGAHLNKQLARPEWNGIKRICERSVDDHISAAKGEPNLRIEDE